jgi:hypothetical protein
MLRRSAPVSLAFVFTLFAACGEDSEGGGSVQDGAGTLDAMTDRSMAGGSSGVGGATGGTSGVGGATGGTGGAHVDAGESHAGSGGAASASASDASIGDALADAAREAADEPSRQCLGASESCGGEEACCEAYVCRSGKCCVPSGIRSWCTRSSDCCTNSCILNQCTCVPLGYSCNGPGQCCSGFECRGGTCICPPDIRGCN